MFSLGDKLRPAVWPSLLLCLRLAGSALPTAAEAQAPGQSTGLDSLAVGRGATPPVADSARSAPSYQLPAVTVTATRQGIASHLQPVIRRMAAWESGEDVLAVVDQLPMSFLKRYGGPGGLSSLGSGGANARHTQILLDGIPLNSPQFGSLDLASLPLGLVGALEYLPHGGPSLFGGDALGATLSLLSRPGSDGISLAAGSYGWSHFQGEKQWPQRRWRLAVGHEAYEGDYPFLRNGRTVQRQNNGYVKDYLRTGKSWGPPSRETRFGLWTSRMQKQVPGLSWAPTPAARQDDLWGLAYLIAQRGTPERQHDWQLFTLAQRFTFKDPAAGILGAHDMTSIGGVYQFSTISSAAVSHRVRLEQRLDRLVSTNTSTRLLGRSSLSANLQWRASPATLLAPTARLTWSPGGGAWFTAQLVAGFEPPAANSPASLTILASTNRQQPTLNDLYWEPGGNPALRPEKSTALALKGRRRLGGTVLLHADAVYSHYADLIEWQPGPGGVWSPKNLRSAATLAWSLRGEPASDAPRYSIAGGLAGVQSRNLTAGANFGKPLRYTSLLSGHLRVRWQPVPALNLELRAHGRSPYISFYNFPRDTFSPAQTNLDVVLRLHRRTAGAPDEAGRPRATLVVNIQNLFDQPHESVPGYPEPGRSVTLSLHYQRSTP